MSRRPGANRLPALMLGAGLMATALLAAAARSDDRPAGLLSSPPATQPRTVPPPQPALRIAAILPLSGNLAVYGASARRGLELAVGQINAILHAPQQMELVAAISIGVPAEEPAPRKLRPEGSWLHRNRFS